MTYIISFTAFAIKHFIVLDTPIDGLSTFTNVYLMRIFSYLKSRKECSTTSKCFNITSADFQAYGSNICGVGTSPYNLLNEANEYVYSTSLNKYSITFDISYKYRIEVTNYLIETRTNNNP